MKVYLVRDIYSEYTLGIFSTLEHAKAACEKSAARQNCVPSEWRSEPDDSESIDWYFQSATDDDSESMRFSIRGYVVDGDLT